MATESPLRSSPQQKNLKDSLIALGLLVASGVLGFIAMDLFMPSGNSVLIWMLIGLAFFLMVMAVIYAIITLTKTLKDVKENKSGKNQAAIAISILVLVLVTYEILSRLMF